MRSHLAILLLLSSTMVALGQAQPDETQALRKADEELLRRSGLTLDGPTLLKVFRDRTLSKEEEGRLGQLAVQLGHASFSVREKATIQLKRAGRLAFKVLQDALGSGDAEVVRRAELIMREVQLNTDAPLLQAVARQVGRLKPEEAAEVVIAFFSFASNVDVQDELRNTLAAVAVRDGQPVAAVVAALAHKTAPIRAAAGEALIKAKVDSQRQAVGALLNDADLNVRLQIALAMIQAHDKRGVATLIDLLERLPVGQAWQAEDTLRQLAGEKGPTASLGLSKVKDVHAGWVQWWQQAEKDIDLAKVSQLSRQLGFTLISQMAGVGKAINQGAVYEIGPDGKERWRINNIRYAVDAVVVGPDRVLIAEYLTNQVTERDFKGTVVWTHQIPSPICVQRLPGGRTFITTRQKLVIVDRNGKEEFSFNGAAGGIIYSGRWLPGGQMIYINSAGSLVRINAQGQQVNTFQVGRVYATGANIDVLPGGRIVVPVYSANKVIEFTLEGKQVWEATIPLPTSAVRLPNGNTLVACLTQQRVVELNRDGQEVWSHRCDGRPYRARRR